MPRKLRLEYPGAIYRVMSRGTGRRPIFRGLVDRLDFVKTLAETCAKAGFQAHACCVMDNHFHLVVDTPNASLVADMKWFLSSFTPRYNHRNRLVGHLFNGRSKALVLDGSGDGSLRTVCDCRNESRRSRTRRT